MAEYLSPISFDELVLQCVDMKFKKEWCKYKFGVGLYTTVLDILDKDEKPYVLERPIAIEDRHKVEDLWTDPAHGALIYFQQRFPEAGITNVDLRKAGNGLDWHVSSSAEFIHDEKPMQLRTVTYTVKTAFTDACT